MHILPALMVLGLLAGCSSETGIVIKTTTSAGFDQPIDSLQFFVGQNTVGAEFHFSDSNPLDVVALHGRDITRNPYKVLLRPDSEASGPIVVAVLAFDSSGILNGFAELPEAIEFVEGSVVQWDLEIGGDTTVILSDTGCLRWQRPDGAPIFIGVAGDEDCDGVIAGDGPDEDCNDLDPFQSPNVPEDCFNEIDDNCNDFIDAEDTVDFDDDGFSACGEGVLLDCNDNNNAIYPGAKELCDGLDNDCNNRCDDGYDKDGDGVSAPCGSVVQHDGETSVCVAMGDPDCEPGNSANFPGNTETCDGIDNDCDQLCDEDPELDLDSDGYTTCGSRPGLCGTSDLWIDCAPDDALVHPGAHELCDNIDNDCDNVLDPPFTPCFESSDASALACLQGRRVCSGGIPEVSCYTAAPDRTTLPNEWCADYQSCDADQQIADPFECSLDVAAGTGTPEVCTVRMSSPSTLCDSQVIRIQHDAGAIIAPPCSYTLIGGNRQQGYVVSLVDPSDPDILDTREVLGCTAGFRIVSAQGHWPDSANIPILFVDGDGVEHEIQIKLKPALVDTCDSTGLACETWVNIASSP